MPMPSPQIISAADGAVADTLATNERLLEIIVQIFQRGEFNRLRLANKAIAKLETAVVSSTGQPGRSRGTRHRPHHDDV